MKELKIFIAGATVAQGPQKSPGQPTGAKTVPAQRKFQILVTNEAKPNAIIQANSQLRSLQLASRHEGERGLLSELLKTAYKSTFVQKTVNASSNLLSLGVSYIAEAVSYKNAREQWLRTARQQCNYNQRLSSETTISDFYAVPSTKGALDPENMKFEGFGCRNYIEAVNTPGEGIDVFYVFCKMRRDDEGLQYIVDHSKFLVELDTLVISPRYCNLPNDSTGRADSRFSFKNRDDLNLTLKVRIYSSWFNQAMLLAKDQQLGEFTINVKVDKNKLNADSLFVYDKSDPDFEKLISIDGDCFIVPRSYTGTLDGENYQPSWGTGQYRVEMEVTETCRLVEDYYKVREAGNGREVTFADATPGARKWDKAKWKTEWNAMKARREHSTPLQNAWNCVVSAYQGTSWVATLTDPLATSLYTFETAKLKEILNMPQVSTTAPASTAAPVKPTAPTGQPIEH